MIKVFLVEDEVVMRNGIRKNIPWKKEGFEFVGEASDGELAYPLIKKEKPDILITDIKMPFMDGLELSRIVKKELPQIKIIILSGYNDFEYAKTAISIGVTDYLLKPVGAAKLLEVLRKVGGIIESEKENDRLLRRYQQEMQENLLQEKHRLWNALVSNRLTTARLLEEGQKLGIDFTASAYLVLLFQVIPKEEGEEWLKQSIQATGDLMEFAENWQNTICFDRSPEGVVFLIKGATEEEVRERMKEGLKRLSGLLSGYPLVEYFGAAGPVVQRLGDIRASYQEAVRSFAGRFFLETNQIIGSSGVFREDADQKIIDVRTIQSKKKERELIDRFLRNGTREEIDSFLEEYFRNMGEVNFNSLIYRQYVILDIFFSVSDFLKSIDLNAEELPEECRDVNGIVTSVSSVELMKQRIRQMFEESIRLRDGCSMKKNSILIEDAKAFIRENYQKEEMSLQTVSAQVNISPSYFSTIFSAETGQTFIEYLTSVRLERAMELLMCSSMRTAEIGYEVGYKDSHYFSYIFKKTIGCSPKDYRNGNRTS